MRILSINVEFILVLLSKDLVGIDTIKRRMIRELINVEQMVERQFAGEINLLEENQHKCHFVHHKS
jgi:hypothetical protein